MADVHVNNAPGGRGGGARPAAGGGGGGQARAPAGALPTDPLINFRERLFHTIFFKVTLAYARGCPKWMRRLLEMMLLLKVSCSVLRLTVYVPLENSLKCCPHEYYSTTGDYS